MSDPLINLLQRRVVLIKVGHSNGSGTLIAHNMVLTCAHVVRGAREKDIHVLLPKEDEPWEYIWERTASMVHLTKMYDFVGGDEMQMEYPDVAIIILEREPYGVETNEPIRTRSNHQHFIKMVQGQSFDMDFEGISELGQRQLFLAYGFQRRHAPSGNTMAEAVSLLYGGGEVNGRVRKLIFTGGMIRPGMSGAPLVDRETGSLQGLVHMTLNPNHDLGAFVIPMEVIWEALEEWQRAGVNDCFQVLQSRLHKNGVKRQYSKEYPLFPHLKRFLPNLITFGILVFVLLFWVFRHLISIQDSEQMSIFLFGFSILSAFIGSWLGRGISTQSGLLKRNIGTVLIRPFSLVVMGILSLFLWVFTSSVWVYGNSESGEVSMMVYDDIDQKVGDQRLIPARGSYRILKFINPFHDTVHIQPLGMELKSLPLLPLERQELYYPTSFNQEPVLIVRFDLINAPFMANYFLEIEIDRSGGGSQESEKRVFKADHLEGTGSLVIGKRKVNTMQDWQNRWEEMLRKDNVPQAVSDKWVSFWSATKPIDSVDLELKDKVLIRVFQINTKELLNQQEFSLMDNTTDRLFRFSKDIP